MVLIDCFNEYLKAYAISTILRDQAPRILFVAHYIFFNIIVDHVIIAVQKDSRNNFRTKLSHIAARR